MVLARACDLGIAMQLTNIARDVGEDARLGRVYLPLAWLREVGLTQEDLLARRMPGPQVAKLVARLLDAADLLYRRADKGIARLPRGCRGAIFAARLIYSEIGRALARTGFDSITQRAHVPRLRKAWLLVRAFLTPWSWASTNAEPALEPARFIVAACAEST
jgi:phytoene synthase